MTSRTLTGKPVKQRKQKLIDPKEERKKQVIKLYKSGLGINEVARIVGMANTSVSSILFKNNIEKHEMIRIEDMIRYFLKFGDFSANEIAKFLSVDNHSVSSRIARINCYKYRCQCGHGMVLSLKKPI